MTWFNDRRFARASYVDKSSIVFAPKALSIRKLAWGGASHGLM